MRAEYPACVVPAQFGLRNRCQERLRRLNAVYKRKRGSGAARVSRDGASLCTNKCEFLIGIGVVTLPDQFSSPDGGRISGSASQALKGFGDS